MLGRKILLTGTSALALSLVAGTAAASIIVDQDFSLSTATTNWTRNLSVNQFDPALGTLEKVEIFVSGASQSIYRVESFQTTPTSHFFRLNGTLAVRRPDLSVLASAAVLHEQTDNLAAHDGTFDWDGASGETANINKTLGPVNEAYTAPIELAAFTGNGTINLPVTATFSSFFQGQSNVARLVTTVSNAEIRVRYTYIPTPGSMAMLGMAGLIAGRRRR